MPFDPGLARDTVSLTSTRRSNNNFTLFVGLALVAQSGPPIQARSCFPCGIEISHVADLGELEGDGVLGTPTGAVVRDQEGRFYVVSGESTSQISVFDAQGRFLKIIGRLGDGPGEFRSIHAILARGDTLWAFDGRLGRITLLNERGDILEMARFTGTIDNVAGLTNGDLAIAGLIGDDSLLLPIHYMTVAGRIKASFGPAFRRQDYRDFYVSQRLITAAPGGGVWAAPRHRYELHHWDESGHSIGQLHLSRPWFPEHDRPGALSRSDAPAPELLAIQADSTGVIWTLTMIAEPDWYEGLAAAPVRSPEGDFYPIVDLDRVFKTRIEVLDAANGDLIAQDDVDDVLFAFASDGLAVSSIQDQQGYPRLRVWRLGTVGLSTSETTRRLPAWIVLIVLITAATLWAVTKAMSPGRLPGSDGL
jgi:hypothetical protein